MNRMKTFKLLTILAAILLLAGVAMPGYGQKDIVVRKPSATKKSGTATKKSSATTTTKKTATTSKPSGTAKQKSGTQQKPATNPVLKNLVANMVRVEGGTFTMGATPEQRLAQNDEKPTHQVTLSSYYIGKYEVTQEEWETVMGSNPSSFKGAKLPVEQVSWDDCMEFIHRLNQKTGKNFRLPTEAEWEFAARGGCNGQGFEHAGSNDLLAVGWYSLNSGGQTHPVGQRNANELGLYDMSGNVMEWCSDWYGAYPSSPQTDPTGVNPSSGRVSRGGGWKSDSWICRVSIRHNTTPSTRYETLGFRLACSTL